MMVLRVLRVVTITICSEHTRNLSPLSLPASTATLLSWHWIFLSHKVITAITSTAQMETCQTKFWSRRDVLDVNKQDVDWRHFMMLPSCQSGTGPLLWSDGRCFVDISQNQDLSLCLLQLDTSFVLRTQTGGQAGRQEATNIGENNSGNYLLKRLRSGWPSLPHPGCVLVIYDLELDSVLWLWHEPIKSGKKSFPDPVLTSRYWRLVLYPC